MKKKWIGLLSVAAAVALLATFAGCNKDEDGASKDTASDSSQTSTSSGSENNSSDAGTGDNASEVVSQAPLAESTISAEPVTFTLTLPKEWNGKVTQTTEENGAVNVWYTKFYETRDTGYDGKLFGVMLVDSQTYADEYEGSIPCEKLGEKNGQTAIWVRVTDMRGNPDDMDACNEYVAMMNELKTIVPESFSFD